MASINAACIRQHLRFVVSACASRGTFGGRARRVESSDQFPDIDIVRRGRH